MRAMQYHLIDTRLGDIGFVWTYDAEKPSIKRICLPSKDGQLESMIRSDFPNARKSMDHIVLRIEETIREYLEGVNVVFSFEYLDMDPCGEFQKKVLRLDRRIPKGMVATYGGLAKKLRNPKAARAVGHAQATNPFPIMIPCHRVVRSDGALGGFGGGLDMKRTLLQLEGVIFDAAGKVRREHLWL